MIDVKEREAPRPRSASRPRAMASGNHGDFGGKCSCQYRKGLHLVTGPLDQSIPPRYCTHVVTDTSPARPPPGATVRAAPRRVAGWRKRSEASY